ncbi:MAG TPA: PAS domain S-box protein, partial [Candidatus Dormibacteraeota bacterium]|nr:PAS domain S-box protein [Candidatus Dormibacteraeota bacterium]
MSRETAARSGADEEIQAFLESAPDAAVIVDAQGQITIVNRQTEKLFGYSREELLGRPVEMLIPARHRSGHILHRAKYAKHPQVRPMGVTLDLHGVRKDGTEF